MKILKIVLLSLVSVFVAVYLAFLFILPYAIDLDKYAPQLTNEIQKNTGFKVNVKGLKVKTAWNLSGGAMIDKTDLMYPTGEKFAQINNLEVKLSLLPLFLGQIRVDSVNLDKIILSLKVEKSGKFLLEKYLPKTASSATQNSTKEAEMPFKFSASMPDIKAKKYKITFVDAQTSKAYSIKGEDFKVSDFVLDKKIKVKAKGQVILDNRKQISYNLSMFSKLFPIQADAKIKTQPQSFNIIEVFNELYKYNLNAAIKADLRISGEVENPSIDGIIDLDKISLVLGGKTLPQSSLKLGFNRDKVKINSSFYTGLDEKALITGVLNNGRKKSINLDVVSKKTDIGNTFLIANTLLHVFGIKDLEGISGNGHLNANFNLNSDFKTIHSKGFLRIDNANITHSVYKASLNSINADVDFSQNSINIIKSSAKLNGEPIIIRGTIDSKANADLSVFAQNLQLKGLLATLGQIQTLKENDISSGLVNLKASIKGRLDKAIPTIDIVLSNVSLRNKPNKAQIKFATAKVKAVATGKVNEGKFGGKIEVLGLRIYPSSTVSVISVPTTSLSFNEKNLNIDKALVYLNNSKIDVFGKVNDYANSKINIDITARGLMVSKDIKSMLPSQNQSGVKAVGKIPLLVRITGGQKQEIYAQMLANSKNHLAVFDINTLRGKTSLISAQLSLAGENLKIHEIGVYALNSNKGLSSDMKANVASAVKIATVGGRISDLSSASPTLQGVVVNIPNQIESSIPGYSGSNIKVKADLEINGRANKPVIKGALSIPSIEIPTIKTNLKSVVLRFNKNSIALSCPQVQIANSLMGFNSILDNDFSRGVVVNSADFYSSYLDLDTLGVALSNLPQNVNGPGADLGISVLSGKGHINKFKTGGLVATNVSSDFILKQNVLKMSNVQADAYFGKIAGSVSYNLIYGNIGLDLQGRGLSAGPAIKGLTGMPDKITGKLDFDSNISMLGVTQEQLIRSLKGNAEFVISNGKMGTLGKLEHLLYAQNILSNTFFKTTINVIAKAVSVKNTGVFRYIKGKTTFSNGWANISSVKTSGPSMSMYVSGRYNLLDNSANLIILGRLSDDVVRLLGPIGDFSVDKVLSRIPKLGSITSYMINQITTNPEYENTSLIPDLTPKTELPTKEFKVLLNGGLESQSSVKSFKWLSKPQAAVAAPSQNVQIPRTQVQDAARQVLQQVVPKYLPQTTTTGVQTQYVPPKKIIAPVADFINALPDLQ
jgi:hypothetical protein